MKPKRLVTVTTAHDGEVTYSWATGVQENRKGSLQIMQGWRQRAFHPAGEWTKYTVAAPGAER